MIHADFCVDALKEAVAKHDLPDIMDPDQDNQFTGSAWIITPTEAGVRILMDGRGAIWTTSSLGVSGEA